MDVPRDAIIAVTHRCNAHCRMCNVWRSKAPDRLLPVHMSNLPRGLRTINLTGGEPFLRPDLVDFVTKARDRCPDAKITISTNGYMPNVIRTTLEAIRRVDPHVRLALSLDGIGQAHDRVRGDRGAFNRAIRLIERLRASGFANLRLSMTISRDNADQLAGVAELADAYDLELGVVAAHDSWTHLGVTEKLAPEPTDRLAQDFYEAEEHWLRSWRPKLWVRAHFAEYTYEYLAGRPVRLPCGAGSEFFFVQADGTVYSCSVRGQKMGDLTRDSWREIWQGQAAEQARHQAAACTRGCWMICTARGLYRDHPLWVIRWIAKRKLLAHVHWFRQWRKLRAGG